MQWVLLYLLFEKKGVQPVSPVNNALREELVNQVVVKDQIEKYSKEKGVDTGRKII